MPAPAPASVPVAPQFVKPAASSGFAHASPSRGVSSYSASNNASTASKVSYEKPEDFSVVMIPDEAFDNCQCCAAPFNISLRRRHHCRLCGNLFCADCSPSKVMLPLDGPEFKVRWIGFIVIVTVVQ